MQRPRDPEGQVCERMDGDVALHEGADGADDGAALLHEEDGWEDVELEIPELEDWLGQSRNMTSTLYS